MRCWMSVVKVLTSGGRDGVECESSEIMVWRFVVLDKRLIRFLRSMNHILQFHGVNTFPSVLDLHELPFSHSQQSVLCFFGAEPFAFICWQLLENDV